MTCPHWPIRWSAPARWCATAKCCCFLLSRNVHLCHPSISERAMLFRASSSLLKRENWPMNSGIIQLTGQLQNPGISLGSSLNRVNSLILCSDSVWASLAEIPKIVRRDKKLLNRNVFLKAETRNVTFADICEAGKYNIWIIQAACKLCHIQWFSALDLWQVSSYHHRAPTWTQLALGKLFQTWSNSILTVSIVF